MEKEEEPPVQQDLEWEPVLLREHLFAIEKLTDEYVAATEEMIWQWRERAG